MLKRLAYFVGNRQAEWVMVIAMLGLAVQTIVFPRTLELETFAYLVQLTSQNWVGFIYLSVSYIRAAALVVNGRSYIYGPQIRALCALAGAMIWAQMDLSIIRVLFTHPAAIPSSGIPIYLALTLSELFTAYRAMTDVRKPI